MRSLYLFLVVKIPTEQYFFKPFVTGSSKVPRNLEIQRLKESQTGVLTDRVVLEILKLFESIESLRKLDVGVFLVESRGKETSIYFHFCRT